MGRSISSLRGQTPLEGEGAKGGNNTCAIEITMLMNLMEKINKEYDHRLTEINDLKDKLERAYERIDSLSAILEDEQIDSATKTAEIQSKNQQIKTLESQLTRLKDKDVLEQREIEKARLRVEENRQRFFGHAAGETYLNYDTATVKSERNNDEDSTKSSKVRFDTRQYSIQDIAQMLPPMGVKEYDFDIEMWLDNVERLIQAYDIDQKAVMAAIPQKLAGTVQKWYQRSVMPNTAWSECKQIMIDYFRKSEGTVDIVQTLLHRTKSKEQSLSDFYMDMDNVSKGLVPDAMFCPMVMRQSGVSQLSKEAYKGETMSRLKLWKLIQQIERMQELNKYDQVAEPRKNQDEYRLAGSSRYTSSEVTRSSRSISPARTSRSISPARTSSTDTVNKIKVCTECKRTGHWSQFCPTTTKCYKCGQKGHFAKNCAIEAIDEEPKSSHSDCRSVKSDNSNETVVNVNWDARVQTQCEIEGKSRQITALVDTGASVSFINIKILSKVELDKFIDLIKGSTFKLTSASDNKIKVLGSVKAKVVLKRKVYLHDFLLVDRRDTHYDMLIGRDFLLTNKLNQVNLGFHLKSILIDKSRSVKSVQISPMSDIRFYLVDTPMRRYVRSQKKLSLKIPDTIKEEQHELFSIEIGPDNSIELVVGDTAHTTQYLKTIEKIFVENYLTQPVIDTPVRHEIKIKVKSDKVVSAKPRRMGWTEREAVRKQVQELLDDDIISESDSEFASNIVLVKKKNGKLRMCVDYRKLNEIIEKDRFPMPVIEDALQKLSGKRYFSSLDLRNGFYHVDVEEDSRKFTAFVTQDGQYEFKKMPFGFANAPAAFVKYLSKVLRKFLYCDEVIVYMDDILIATETIERHLELLTEILRELAKNKVKLQMEKCTWLQEKTDFLGYSVNAAGIQLNSTHVDSIKSYARPIDVKSVQRFVGMASYFRKFIEDFKGKVAPLQLIIKNKEFKWSKEHEDSFQTVIKALIDGPVLKIFNKDAETELHTDASSAGYGAILMQRCNEDGKFHPVSYFSKKTTAPESKLHSFELETLAVVYGIKRFRNFLLGKRFKLVTDCNAMKLTLGKREVSPKIERWALFLEEYDFELEHRAGDRMKHVDALSRQQVLIQDEINETEETGEENGEGSDLFVSKIVLAQGRDENILTMIDSVNSGTLKGYEIREGILYHVDGTKLQMVVPLEMQNGVMVKMHDQLGHFGVKKTVNNIKRYFHFAGMTAKVEAYIKGCLMCLQYNSKVHKKEHYMHLIEREPKPLHTIHIDHVGPIETTKRGHLHILVVVDAFTKYVRLYPTKTTNSTEVIRHLENYFRAYSVPCRIVSDRGTAFSSAKFSDFCKKYKVHHIMNATACPRANGQVERFNRTLLPLLAKKKSETGQEWDQLMWCCERSLNNMVSSTTNKAASELLYGTRISIGDESDIEKWIDQLNNDNIEPEIDRDEEFRLAKARIDASQLYNKEKYDEGVVREHKFEQGQLVLIKTRPTGKCNKLTEKFRGPYIITKVLDKDRYVVSDIDDWQQTGRRYLAIHDSSRLKLFELRMEDVSLRDVSFNEEQLDLNEMHTAN